MKRISAFLVLMVLVSLIYAQVPQGISYQAVVRDAQGNIVANQNVAFRFSIIQQSINGTTVYSERQTTTTNSLGLVNLAIGTGQVLSGNFANIAWSQYPHFLKVELDIQGGTNYVNMGTTQLLSVPYALVANRSISDTLWVASGNNIRNTNPGRVGIGINNPTGKVTIQGDTSNVLFEVRDKDGNPVFVVYQDSVHVFVSNSNSKTNKGTFAVSSKAQTKAGAHTVFRIVPDSIVEIKDAQGLPVFRAFQDSVHVYVDATGNKTNKGTFAVSSKAQTKNNTQYLRITPDSSRVYTEDPNAGFGVRDLSGGSATSYMTLTPENYFIGHEAGENLTTGIYNSAIGFQSAKELTDASYNTIFGYQAGRSITTGSSNVLIGTQAGFSIDSGYWNCFVGDEAGMYCYGSNNNFIGKSAGKFSSVASYNNFIGTYSGLHNASGSQNIFIGNQSGFWNTIGNYNIYIGDNAGFSCDSNTNVTLLGSFTQAYSNIHNASAIGFGASVNDSNKIRLGNSYITQIEGQVPFSYLSDKRFKTNIKENVKGLEFIMKLKPVSYDLDNDKFDEFLHKNMPDSLKNKLRKNNSANARIKQLGFIAQDVEQAAKECNFDFTGIHKPKNENDYYTLAYSVFTVPIVKAIQEQQQQIIQLQNENLLIKKELEQLKKQIQELKK